MALGGTIGVATTAGTMYANGLNPFTLNRIRPNQTHHFATNKNSRYTPEMQKIVEEFGLDLNGEWNRALMPHQGRHPNAYHRWVLENMIEIKNTPGMNQQQFINKFNIRVKHPVLSNPNMLRKSYWK